MFEIGNFVVYGVSGVCKIDDIKNLAMGGEIRKYYVLKPIFTNNEATIFAPVDNGKVVMRKIMSREDAERFAEEITSIRPLSVDNEKARKEIYSEAMSEADPYKWIGIIKCIERRKMILLRNKKKLAEIDMHYDSLAKTSLYGELSVALGISREEAEELVGRAKAAR